MKEVQVLVGCCLFVPEGAYNHIPCPQDERSQHRISLIYIWPLVHILKVFDAFEPTEGVRKHKQNENLRFAHCVRYNRHHNPSNFFIEKG
jgi:hypothetical protein